MYAESLDIKKIKYYIHIYFLLNITTYENSYFLTNLLFSEEKFMIRKK